MKQTETEVHDYKQLFNTYTNHYISLHITHMRAKILIAELWHNIRYVRLVKTTDGNVSPVVTVGNSNIKNEISISKSGQ